MAACDVKALQHRLGATVPLGERLADRLLSLLALAKGVEFNAVVPCLHSPTNTAVIQKFTGPIVDLP